MVVRAPHHSKNFFDCLAASGREASVRTFFSCNNERTSDRRACRASYFYDLPLPLFRRFFFYTAQREFFLFHSNKVGVFPPLFPPLALPRAPVGKVLHALSGGRSEAEAEATGQGKAAWSEEGGTGTEREGGRGLLSLSLSLSAHRTSTKERPPPPLVFDRGQKIERERTLWHKGKERERIWRSGLIALLIPPRSPFNPSTQPLLSLPLLPRTTKLPCRNRR